MYSAKDDIYYVITLVCKIASLAVDTSDHLTASIMYDILSNLQYLLHEKDFDCLSNGKECSDDRC